MYNRQPRTACWLGTLCCGSLLVLFASVQMFRKLEVCTPGLNSFFFLLLLLQGLVSNNAKNIRQGQLAPFFYQSSLQQEIPALDFTLKPKKLHGSKQKYQIPSLELRLGLHFCHTGMAKPKWVIPFSFLNSFCLKVLMLWTSAKNFWISFLWTFSDTACIPGTGNLPTLLPVIFFFLTLFSAVCSSERGGL